jgi:hypothetical protein
LKLPPLISQRGATHFSQEAADGRRFCATAFDSTVLKLKSRFDTLRSDFVKKSENLNDANLNVTDFASTIRNKGIIRRDPVTESGETREKRRYLRIELEVEVIVRTDSALLPGRTHDISEFGMSAILPVELHEGDEVELQIRLPRGTETTRAIVRHRNVYRHGFEFAQPLHEIFSNDAIIGGRYATLTHFDLRPTISPK